MSVRRTQLFVLGVLITVAAAIPVWRHYDQVRRDRAAQARLAAAQAQKKHWADYLSALAAKEEAARRLVQGPAERSEWLEGERQPYLDALRASAATVLVVPPMDDELLPGIDATARVTIARRLAERIDLGGQPRIDPGFVFRAFGEPRTMSFEQMRSLLIGSGFKELITGKVSHDPNGDLHVVLVRRELHGSGVPTRRWEKSGLHVDDYALPEDVVTSVLDEAVRALRLEPAPRGRPPSDLPSPALVLAPTPLAALKAQSGLVAELWLQQLLAVLAPDETFSDGRVRERIFEKTLSGLDAIGRDSPDYLILKARALAYLGRRPAAAQLLEKANNRSPEAQALLAYVQSDLIALRRAVPRIQRPLPRLIAELELFAMRNWFGDVDFNEQRSERARIVASVPAGWRTVVAYYFAGFGTWNLPSAWPIKELLDRDYPVPGYAADDVLAGRLALGATPFDARTQARLELAPLVHARRWRAHHLTELCCGDASEQWSLADRTEYLDLLSDRAGALAIARLQFLWLTQGQEQSALDLAALYDDLLFGGGHPQVEAQRMLARLRLVGSGMSPEEKRTMRDAYEDLWRVIAWLPGQSYQTGYALSARWRYAFGYLQAQGYRSVTGGMRPPDPVSLPRSQDLPLRSEFILGLTLDPRHKTTRKRNLHLLAVGCDHTILEFASCDMIDRFGKEAGLEEESAKLVEGLIAHRFRGNAGRSTLLAQIMERQGKLEEAKSLLEDAVAGAAGQEDAYISLARIFLHEGDFKGAQRAYLRYPGLRQGQNGNTVGLSIYARRAGSAFLRRGLPQLAQPLIRIAARNDDGSSANLQAQAEAATMDGDYEQAIDRLGERYRRYHQSDAVLGLSGLRFIQGDPKLGWAVLQQVLPDASSSRPYLGAAVGFRIEQAPYDRIAAWRDEFRNAKVFGPAQWARFAAFDAEVIDRSADAIGAYGRHTRAAATPQGAPDYLYVLSDVYAAFKGKNYPAAVAAVNPLRDFYRRPLVEALWETPTTYTCMAPYLAFALLESGAIADAHKLLADPKKRLPQFEAALIDAEVAAVAGDYANAEAGLRRARGLMPALEGRLLPAGYVYAEIGEALYAATHHKAFLDQALDFAEGAQQYEPWEAWTYAFEALHATSEERRVRAAGIADALDPQSDRLARVPAGLKAKGREWYRRTRPFQARPHQKAPDAQRRI